MIRRFIDSQGGRRLLVFIMVFGAACYFLQVGKITEAGWLDITWKVATAFIAGATVTGVSDRFTRNGNGKPGKAGTPPPNVTSTHRPEIG